MRHRISAAGSATRSDTGRGDTLVIDTTNFNDTPALRQATRDLHVVERLTRLDADTLRYEFTVADPNVWTAPWCGEYVWPTSSDRVYEYACHEANYSFRGILGGARILEQDVRDGKVQENNSPGRYFEVNPMLTQPRPHARRSASWPPASWLWS